MFDSAPKPIPVHLSCDDFVDFPVEMKVDGQFGYVPPEWLPISEELVADLRAYQILWEVLPLPEEDPNDGDDMSDGDVEDDEDDDLEFEKLWRMTKRLEAAAHSDPELARQLAEEVDAGAGDLDESDRQALLPRLAAGVAAFDLPWARALVHEATTLIRESEDPGDRAQALVVLVGAVARFDPGEAETLARGIPDTSYRDRAILLAVEQLSSADPDRAEVLARSISHPRLRAWARATPADRTGILAFSEWTEVLVVRLRTELGPDFAVRVT